MNGEIMEGRTRPGALHRDALNKAVRYAEEAEACDSAQHYEDRDVRLHFAAVWANIALASRPPGTGPAQTMTTNPKEL
jgi:hypothetical protein